MKTVGDSIQILTGVMSTLTIQPGDMLAAITPDMLATGLSPLCTSEQPPTLSLILHQDLADYLVRKGVPFRETHHISGQVVALAEKKCTPMDKLSHKDLQSVDKRLGADFVFDHEKSVEMRTATGGTVSSFLHPNLA